jgi:hypothetical protein
VIKTHAVSKQLPNGRRNLSSNASIKDNASQDHRQIIGNISIELSFILLLSAGD